MCIWSISGHYFLRDWKPKAGEAAPEDAEEGAVILLDIRLGIPWTSGRIALQSPTSIQHRPTLIQHRSSCLVRDRQTGNPPMAEKG